MLNKHLTVIIVVFASQLGFATCAQAATTWFCNASNEPVYISVRHHSPSLLFANSRTEGWHKLPVRGLLRSCKIFSRPTNHYLVVAVKREGIMVPVRVSIRWPDGYRRVHVCVPIEDKSFEYRSGSRSDSDCIDGWTLARVSVGVEGGDNDVDLSIDADFSSVTVPDAMRNALERAKEKEEQRDKEATEKRKQDKEKREKLLLQEQVQAIEKYERILSERSKDSLSKWNDYFKRNNLFLCENDFLSGTKIGYKIHPNGYLGTIKIEDPYELFSLKSWKRYLGSKTNLGFDFSRKYLSVHYLPTDRNGKIEWPLFACIKKSDQPDARTEYCHEVQMRDKAAGDRKAIVDLSGPFYLTQADAELRQKGIPITLSPAMTLKSNMDIFGCNANLEALERQAFEDSRKRMNVVASGGFLSASALVLGSLYLLVKFLVRLAR